MADTLYCAFERRSFPIGQFVFDVRHGAIHVPKSSPRESRRRGHSVSGYDLAALEIPVSATNRTPGRVSP
jgi:hypothetical protein